MNAQKGELIYNSSSVDKPYRKAGETVSRRICEECGARLDWGETCDCKSEERKCEVEAIKVAKEDTHRKRNAHNVSGVNTRRKRKRQLYI